jgi:hypothetical protein
MSPILISQARPLLLAAAGRRTSAPVTIWPDASGERSVRGWCSPTLAPQPTLRPDVSTPIFAMATSRYAWFRIDGQE